MARGLQTYTGADLVIREALKRGGSMPFVPTQGLTGQELKAKEVKRMKRGIFGAFKRNFKFGLKIKK